MKPVFEAVSKPGNNSFVVRQFTEKRFSAPYHFHPEYELTLIVKGSGKRYVGSRMYDYHEGDLVLLGASLPHCWKTGDTSKGNSISVVVHFNKNFLGDDFFSKPEMNSVLRLLNTSNYGLHFTAGNKVLKESMLALIAEKDSFKRLLMFLNILYELASGQRYTVLDRKSAYSELSHSEKQRISAVIAYVVDNFQNNISLKVAASKANMTVHAFCKYFKRSTRKTFIETVNDYRIDFATRELIHTDKPVSQICFDSGFNDISNFHKTFKSKINVSPLSYRNTFIKKLF